MAPKEERLVPIGVVASQLGATPEHVRAWAGDAVQEKVDGAFITESLAELIVQTQIKDARRREQEHAESVAAIGQREAEIERRTEEIAGAYIASIKADPRAYDYRIVEPNGTSHGPIGLNRMAQRLIAQARTAAREQAVAEIDGREATSNDSEVLHFLRRRGGK